jgi:hypothetical protein
MGVNNDNPCPVCGSIRSGYMGGSIFQCIPCGNAFNNETKQWKYGTGKEKQEESNSDKIKVLSVKDIVTYSRRLTTDQHLRYVKYDDHKSAINSKQSLIDELNKKLEEAQNERDDQTVSLMKQIVKTAKQKVLIDEMKCCDNCFYWRGAIQTIDPCVTCIRTKLSSVGKIDHWKIKATKIEKDG